MNLKYNELNFPTPQVLKDKYLEKSALIIASGPSTANLLPFKEHIRKNFDVVIGANLTIRDFEEQMDYHLVAEKGPKQIYEYMHKNGYRKDLPRILNYKTLDCFPQDTPIIKTARCNFGGKGKYNIKEYAHNGQEGLLIGPANSQGLSIGTVTLQAMHLAAIMGCTKIYLIGAELVLWGEYDHYYKDKVYRSMETVQKANSELVGLKSLPKLMKRVIVNVGEKEYETLLFFWNSAEYINALIVNRFNPVGIEVYDFSGGLLTNAKQLELHKFIKI